MRIVRTFLGKARGLSTSLRKLVGGSDYGRWGEEGALRSDWDSRTRQIANLIEPGSSVLEFGAGRRVLEERLPAACTYTPSDLVDRGEGTLVCDLNAKALPNFPSHDVVVFSGVLEYVNDVPRLIARLHACAPTIIASYAVYELNSASRRTNGWVNDYTLPELMEVFSEAGYRCEHKETWKEQMIFRFRKQ